MIGIIGAMDVEVDALKNMLEDKREEKTASVSFVLGKLGGKEAVIAKCDPGKVNAALCTQTMILKYNPEMIINVGVAGSLSNELDIGEIAVGSSAVQYDMDTSPLGDPKGFVSGIGVVEINCDKEIAEKLVLAAKNAGDIKYCRGKIATGDRFVADDKTKGEIVRDFDCIVCEMEGAAIGHVCLANKVPYGILRAVSDKADGSSVMDYPAFTQLAAKNSVKIMSEFIKLL